VILEELPGSGELDLSGVPAHTKISGKATESLDSTLLALVDSLQPSDLIFVLLHLGESHLVSLGLGSLGARAENEEGTDDEEVPNDAGDSVIAELL